MSKTLFSENFKITDYEDDTRNLVETIKTYISEHDCPDFSMDISHLNIMEASKVTVLCSTYHWEKYPEGKINWKISSKEIRELVSPLALGNIRLITD